MDREVIHETMSTCWSSMFRVKTPRYLPEDPTISTVHRQHTLLDLVNSGLYAVTALGIFSLSGVMVRDFAGPSSILSVLIALCAVTLTCKSTHALSSQLRHFIHCRKSLRNYVNFFPANYSYSVSLKWFIHV